MTCHYAHYARAQTLKELFIDAGASSVARCDGRFDDADTPFTRMPAEEKEIMACCAQRARDIAMMRARRFSAMDARHFYAVVDFIILLLLCAGHA